MQASCQYIFSGAPPPSNGFEADICFLFQIVDPGYLKCLNNDNVELVYDPIDTITEKGIKCKSGKEHPLDVLILGTGFDVVSTQLHIVRSPYLVKLTHRALCSPSEA